MGGGAIWWLTSASTATQKPLRGFRSRDAWRYDFGGVLRYFIFLIVFLFSLASHASEESGGISGESVEDMHLLVENGSDSRKYLWCSVLSGELGMEDVRQLFVRKAATFSTDQYGFLMAHSYMTGFVDSEMKHLQSGEDAGKVLAALYSRQCMNELLPSE